MVRRSKLDTVMTWIFMVMAVAAVICYFVVDDHSAFLYCGGAAIFIRLVQYLMRFIS